MRIAKIIKVPIKFIKCDRAFLITFLNCRYDHGLAAVYPESELIIHTRHRYVLVDRWVRKSLQGKTR